MWESKREDAETYGYDDDVRDARDELRTICDLQEWLEAIEKDPTGLSGTIGRSGILLQTRAVSALSVILAPLWWAVQVSQWLRGGRMRGISRNVR